MTDKTQVLAAASLRDLDPVLAGLVDLHGPPPGRGRVPASLRFAALARAIVYQQLAGNAAAAIHGRFRTALGGTVTAEATVAASPELLTSCGLSRAKETAIRDLATKVVTGQISLDRIGRLGDEEIVDHLVQVRGIGRWTAEMFLLDTLGRPDVWPTGDYGVRAGFAKAWQLPDIPTPKQLAVLGEPYRPYRSAVAWYCWRTADTRR
jgi:3-methyladenine DNA glycosylase/8-oxoguanine DNA glycosylase